MANPIRIHRRWPRRIITVIGLAVTTALAVAIPALAHPTFSNNGPGFPNPSGGTGGLGQTPPYPAGSRPTLNMFLPFEQQGVIFNGAENTTVDVTVTLPVDFTNPACGAASTTTGNEQVGTPVPGWTCALETVNAHQVLHWHGPQVSPTQTDADSAQYFTFQATMPSPPIQTSYGAVGGPEGIYVTQVYADGTTERWIPPNDPGAGSDPGHVANGIVRTVAVQVAMVTRSSTSLPNNVTIAQLQNLYNCVSPPPVGTFVPMLPQFGSPTRASLLSLLGIPDTTDIGTAGNRACVRTTDVNNNPLQENSGNLLFAANQIEPYSVSALIAQESREVADVHGTAIMGEIGGTVSLLANPAVTNGITYLTRGSTTVPKSLTIANLQNLYNCVSPPPVGTFVPMLPAFGSTLRTNFLNELGIPDTAGIGTAGNRPCVRTTDVNGNPLQQNTGNLLFAANQLVPYDITAFINQQSRTVPDVHGTTILGEISGTIPSLPNPATP